MRVKRCIDNTLYVMVGIPGSGKSTWVKKHIKDFDKCVSRDEIRFSMLKEGDPYFAHEKEVFKKYISTIKEYLEDGYDVYADATHLNESSRSKLLYSLGTSLKNVQVVAVYIKAPMDKILSQNALRTGRSLVPEEQIRQMASNFIEPELKEGFNAVYIVKDGLTTVRV